jgi:O-antigen ligase
MILKKPTMIKILILVFLISPIFSLVMPSAHSLWPIIFSIVGLFCLKDSSIKNSVIDRDLKRSWVYLIGGFYLFSLIGIILALGHGNDWGHYEIYVPFILFPALMWWIRSQSLSPNMWFQSFAVGSFLAFVYAIYQSHWLGLGRAFGSVGNPIPFGNTAIVMGMIAIIVFLFYKIEDPYCKIKKAILLIGSFSAVGASLLSGSKGGWLSIFIIGLSASYWYTIGWRSRKRHILSAFIVAGFLVIGYLAPAHLVKDRIISGVAGAAHWLETGQVTDGSVSMRFEIWQLSSTMFMEKPWFGHGSIEGKQRWNELLKTGDYDQGLVNLVKANPNFSTPDNEILGVLKMGGLVGALGYLCAYLGVWMAFFQWRKHQDHVIKTCSYIGLMLVPVYLEFGLSVSVFGTNVFRSMFVYLAVALLSFITVRNNFLKNLNE